MNKKYINFIATFLLAAVFSVYLPWWSVMMAAFLTALIFHLKKASVFFVPFLAVTLYWGVYSYMLSSSNDFILAEKIAILLPLGGSPYVLILVTAIVGGIAAGVAAVFGSQVKYILK